MRSFRKRWKLCVATSVVMACGASSAYAGLPVQWDDHPDGGTRWYDVVWNVGMTWEAAMDDAASEQYLGYTGHLGTINVPGGEEQTFIETLLQAGRTDIWLGAVPDGSGWKWINDEPWGYENWAPGESTQPIDSNYRIKVSQAEGTMGLWYQVPQTTQLAYLREYTVPEPATLAILALGGLAAIRRR